MTNVKNRVARVDRLVLKPMAAGMVNALGTTRSTFCLSLSIRGCFLLSLFYPEISGRSSQKSFRTSFLTTNPAAAGLMDRNFGDRDDHPPSHKATAWQADGTDDRTMVKHEWVPAPYARAIAAVMVRSGTIAKCSAPLSS